MSIDVFQLMPSSSDEDINLCMEWIKAQIRAKQTVTVLVKRQEKVSAPQQSVDITSLIQQRLTELSQDARTRQAELLELVQLYQEKNVKNNSLLIEMHIQLAAIDHSYDDKIIEILCKIDEKNRKQYLTQFKDLLKDKIKSLIETGSQQLTNQNQKEALQYFQRAQELNNWYDDRDNQIQISVQIGNTYQQLKEFDQAQQEWEKSIKFIVQNGLQNSYQMEYIYMLNANGQIYYDKKQNTKATQNWDQAITVLSSLTDPELSSKQLLGHLLNNVGMIYYQKGDVKKAIINFQKTIGVYEQIYGKNNISVGNRINNLGEAYRSDKQYDKALEMFNKALEIKKTELNGQPSKSLAATINNIGMTLQNKQVYEEAIIQFEEVLKMYDEPGVYSDPNSGDAAIAKSNTMHSIAECYRSLHNLDQCINYFRQAYKLKSKELKIYHKSTQHTAIQLASALFQKNSFEESLIVFEEVLHGQKDVSGAESLIVAQTINNIGTVLSELKQYEKALKYVQEAIVIFEKNLEKTDPYLVKAYENLKNIKAKLAVTS